MITFYLWVSLKIIWWACRHPGRAMGLDRSTGEVYDYDARYPS